MSLTTEYPPAPSYPTLSPSDRSSSSCSPQQYQASGSPQYLSHSPERSHNIVLDNNQTTFHNLQTLVEVSTRMAENQQHELSWQQPSLRTVQDVLNSGPSVGLSHTAGVGPLPPVISLPQDTTLWTDNDQFKLEGLDSLDLTVGPSQDSSARPTILPYRHMVHGGHGGHSSHLQQQHYSIDTADLVQYINLNGEPILPPADPGPPPPQQPPAPAPHQVPQQADVMMDKEEYGQQQGELRLCKVCGEKAGKHSYYGGQVHSPLESRQE